MKRKSVLLVAVLIAALVVGGCGQGKPPAQTGQSSQQGSTPKTFKIGLSEPNIAVAYRQAAVARAKAAASAGGANLVVTDAQGNNQKQLSDVQDLTSQKVDLVLMSPNEAQALVPAAKALAKAKIPLIIVDRTLGSDDYTAFIGSDNKAMGAKAAEYIAKLLNGKGNVVELEGLQGASATTERKEGFEKAIANYSGIKIVADQAGDYRRDKAFNVMQNIIQANSKIDAVYAHNDEMALGAVEALRKAGRLKGTIITGMDGEKAAFDAIKAGDMTATVQYPTFFPEAFELAMKVRKREKVDKKIIKEAPLIDKDNVAKYYDQGI